VFGWLHDLSVWWLAFVIFAATFVVAAGIYALVIALAVGERGKAFKAVSPGMLPPMGLLFGLLIGFLAARSGATQARPRTPSIVRPATWPLRGLQADQESQNWAPCAISGLWQPRACWSRLAQCPAML
jgi:hypothetical protein